MKHHELALVTINVRNEEEAEQVARKMATLGDVKTPDTTFYTTDLLGLKKHASCGGYILYCMMSHNGSLLEHMTQQCGEYRYSVLCSKLHDVFDIKKRWRELDDQLLDE